MNMNMNMLPFGGWVVYFIYKVSLALPFWLIWSVMGIGAKFFPFLPPVYLAPGFWETVGVFIVIPIVYSIFIPRIVNISVNNRTVNKKEEEGVTKT